MSKRRYRTRTTRRDLDLIEYLDQYGVLSTHQIQRLAFQGLGRRTMLRRLRKLDRSKLIQRFFRTAQGRTGLDSILYGRQMD